TDPTELGAEHIVSNLKNESDRSAIVLLGSIIEDCLKRKIEEKLTGLAGERDSFFDFNGVAGTFSSKIMLAKALEVIDSNTRNRLDLLREMRNCSAHTTENVTFSTQEMFNATIQFVPEEVQNVMKGMETQGLRNSFILICTAMMAQIDGHTDAMEKAISMIKEAGTP
ncbi:DUF4145 domain-containing protein, partial [Acetobacter orientalis]